MAEQEQQQRQMQECKEYVERHRVQQLVKDAIVQLCIQKPENPVAFLKLHFQRLELERRVSERDLSAEFEYETRC